MNPTAIQNAFVLGAGLGTRLRSITGQRPKPLIPVCQKPLITFAFDHLIRNGVRRLMINTHHRAETYATAFPDGNYRRVPLEFRHEHELLETAGGIKNVEDLLGDTPFVVYNGDILTDVPIGEAIATHFRDGNEVTLILRSRDGPLHVSFDPDTGRVVDIAQRLQSGVPASYLFTGIYVVDPAFFRRIPTGRKISVIPVFLDMIREGAKLGGVVLDSGHWWDLGTRGQYLDVHRYFAKPDYHFSMSPPPIRGEKWPLWVHPTAEVAPTALLSGHTVVGAGARVGERATLRNCVLWEGSEVLRDSLLDRCIVTGSQPVGGIHTNADL